MNIEEFYSGAGKIYDRYKVKNRDRCFMTSVAMFAVILSVRVTGRQASYSDITGKDINEVMPVFIKDYHKVQLIDSFEGWSDLLDFMSKVPLNLGDYTGRWYEMSNDYKDNALFQTPDDVTNLVFELVKQRVGNEAPEDIKIYDPTAGTGAFLLEAKRRGMKTYGQEVDHETFIGLHANMFFLNMHQAMVDAKKSGPMKAFEQFSKIINT
ncbi:hypothetical protein B0W47_16845 (plasmid) [Komagataeibacter nataicola]|uniref:DNA methylase adenine-specific domain-containing protein n=1 Tax=Komagataeibacter nataicola TaxID=265960 RepID=A0A9N7D096_9PROT|nr:N-6 DNA methylase [Komagataeibacter nataicola]AQU89191.1 hypothetical protein B0W47_16545 [Komagataeibacter nataicola]AQU89247.1 hypothetical protein B0W47_16845 [Komagataeibacter nataicola]PYD66295.1 hypothetical protein CDI09_09105 [Komagataeibacter nataicola]WNM10337.1 N-6 DNA methylase [Komagataeibacter nataicola]GBR23580.1 hypothetical protein AA0616_2559 [Komagataeibacter nataicola NRIC 0616]